MDFFGARYFSSTQGRFTSPDEFWKDSQVGDPQSWNKYAYVRNNPLKYIDPEGEKATVTIETDEEHKKGKVTVNATIALWTNKGISQEDLQKAAQEYKANTLMVSDNPDYCVAGLCCTAGARPRFFGVLPRGSQTN